MNAKLIISYNKISHELKTKYHYDDHQVFHTVWRLLNACPQVKKAFADWKFRDKDPHLQCEGVSWDDLVKIKGLNEYNAFLYIDSMLRNPVAGINNLEVQALPSGSAERVASRRISVDDLRPDLREYVEGKIKEDLEHEEALKQQLLKDGDEIDLGNTPETAN